MNSKQLKRALGPFYHLLVMGYLLARFPDSIPFAPAWLASLLPGRNTLSDRVPWIPFKARAWLAAHLNSDMAVFEYGSGGSTLFFAERVRRVVAVEHDRAWHERLRRTLDAEKVANCEYLLAEPVPAAASGKPSPDAGHYSSSKPECAGMSFETYARAIERYPADSFDLVLVDGRSRSACLLHAVAAVRVGGYVLLDNSNNAEYEPAMRQLERYPRTDLKGIGPYRPPSSWQTTAWHKTSPWSDEIHRPEEAPATRLRA